jgi:hypothetical protein
LPTFTCEPLRPTTRQPAFWYRRSISFPLIGKVCSPGCIQETTPIQETVYQIYLVKAKHRIREYHSHHPPNPILQQIPLKRVIMHRLPVPSRRAAADGSVAMKKWYFPLACCCASSPISSRVTSHTRLVDRSTKAKISAVANTPPDQFRCPSSAAPTQSHATTTAPAQRVPQRVRYIIPGSHFPERPSTVLVYRWNRK